MTLRRLVRSGDRNRCEALIMRCFGRFSRGPPLVTCSIGIAIGFWVGLLPGIGGLSTLALMLPFSYKIKDPVSAFAFLLGMLAVTGTTGDLTSILFGIPGEGSSAALILDGYPMTKNGEAGPRPWRGDHSSVVGALIGAFSLARLDSDHAAAGPPFRFSGAFYHCHYGHHVYRHACRHHR